MRIFCTKNHYYVACELCWTCGALHWYCFCALHVHSLIYLPPSFLQNTLSWLGLVPWISNLIKNRKTHQVGFSNSPLKNKNRKLKCWFFYIRILALLNLEFNTIEVWHSFNLNIITPRVLNHSSLRTCTVINNKFRVYFFETQ